MAYKTAQLNLVSQPPGAGPRQWYYEDTGTSVAQIQGAGFFTDGSDKGLKVNDHMTFINREANQIYSLRISAIQDTGSQGSALGAVLVADTGTGP